MPLVPFDALPDDARVWTFGTDRALDTDGETALLRATDEYLESWTAHGAPLTVGRTWHANRFLVVGVDQDSAGATGCSIDGLFRVLQELQGSLGVNLVQGGRVFFRATEGAIGAVARSDVATLVRDGLLTEDTVVFDTSLTDLGSWRSCFERPAKESWVKELL
ncbi:MAG: hypothetical protein H0W68_00775 [Gemmatimonadaceae bacterium]|nr:hypothetical protein [Gemmatimonadaceae bacterium]